MTKPTRPTATRSEDRGSLEQQLAALQRENADLKARLARGPVDESWFTPGVLSVLALAVFFALWAKYMPMRRSAAAPAVAERPAGEYNPTRPAAPAAAAPTPAPSPGH